MIMPRAYRDTITRPECLGKNMEAKNTYTGSFAVQLINGVRSTVSLRSLADGKVLDAITPGTVQPKPTSIGTMLLPLSPIFLNALSVTKATLAMYPVSSKSERKKKSTTIKGRNESTLPTPVNIPSMTRECMTSFTPPLVNALSTMTVRFSIPFSKSSCKKAPTTLKVR